MNVTDAVKLAVFYAAGLPKLEGADEPTLEEVEFDDPYWLVTLGFTKKVKAQGVSAALRGEEYISRTSFKTFKIDPSGNHGDGEVVSMKIRSLQVDG